MRRFLTNQSVRVRQDAAADIALALAAPQVVGTGLAFADIVGPYLGEARILLEPVLTEYSIRAGATGEIR